MSLELVVAAALFAGVIIYAVLAGADFGTGFYDLTAGGAERGAAIRTRIDHSIGPVWEANHVWLIYVLVVWWTGFPRAFADVMTTLFVPLLLALLGIVLRGASFAFRKYADTLSRARLFGVVFASSSIVTPFFFGTVAGGIASGRVPADGYGDLWTSWINPTSLFGGVIAVGTCAFLAGIFLTADAAGAGETELTEVLRRRSLIVGVVTGAVVFAGLVPVMHDAPTLSDGLLTTGAPLIVLSFLAGVASLLFLLRRAFALARVASVIAVASVVAGWGAGQYPWFLVDELTVSQAAGADSTLQALLVVVALAVILVGPSLALLIHYTTEQNRASSTPDSAADPTSS